MSAPSTKVSPLRSTFNFQLAYYYREIDIQLSIGVLLLIRAAAPGVVELRPIHDVSVVVEARLQNSLRTLEIWAASAGPV